MAPSTLVLVFSVAGFAVTGVISSHVKIDDLKVDMAPNDYFGKIDTEIKPQGDDSSISAKIPIKKNLDEKLQMIANLNFNSIPILKDQVFALCDAISEDGFFKPIVKKIEPTGKFPKSCPIPAGEWKITDYVIDMSDFLPFGIAPSGSFDGNFDIGLPDAKPLIKVLAKGTVSPFGDSLVPNQPIPALPTNAALPSAAGVLEVQASETAKSQPNETDESQGGTSSSASTRPRLSGGDEPDRQDDIALGNVDVLSAEKPGPISPSASGSHEFGGSPPRNPMLSQSPNSKANRTPTQATSTSASGSTAGTPSSTSSLDKESAIKQIQNGLEVLTNVDPLTMRSEEQFAYILARMEMIDRTVNDMRPHQQQSSSPQTNCCCCYGGRCQGEGRSDGGGEGRGEGSAATASVEEDFQSSFPYYEIGELQAFNKLLNTSETAREKFRTFLSTKMHSSEYQASVNNVLAALITNTLASTKLTAKDRKENNPDPQKVKYGVDNMDFWRIARTYIIEKHGKSDKDLIDAQLGVWLRGRADKVRKGQPYKCGH